eukprot:gene20355-27904_t
MAAIAWSYAAARACGLPIEQLFHDGGYRGDAAMLRSAFASGACIGTPLLGYWGLCDPHGQPGDHPFPVETPEASLDRGEAGLKEHIKTIGLFNSKAKNVIALSQILVDEHGGEVPDTREALVKLPGVRRKTANVVLNCWF